MSPVPRPCHDRRVTCLRYSFGTVTKSLPGTRQLEPFGLAEASDKRQSPARGRAAGWSCTWTRCAWDRAVRPCASPLGSPARTPP